MARLQQEHDAARKAGNQELVKQLEARGKAIQQEAHVQVFGTGPYDSLQDYLKPILPAVEKQANVQAVVLTVLHTQDTVEVVDVTDQLLNALHTTDATRKVIQEMKAKMQHGDFDPTKYNADRDKD